MLNQDDTPKKQLLTIHYETTGNEYNRPYPADYVAVHEVLMQSSAIWLLLKCLDWDKLVGLFNYPSTELSWIFDNLAQLGAAMSGHGLARLDNLSDLLDEQCELPEKVRAIISQTYSEMGDERTLNDDEAIMRIRDLIKGGE